MLFLRSSHVKTSACNSRYCSLGRCAMHLDGKGPTKSPSEDRLTPLQTAWRQERWKGGLMITLFIIA
ncbi:hypothetical protein DPMN_084756 [Dreissena polymorpha]|uniref:Uncharacterized protein n=1 Tax=Dreissena polymorpha TaxID=45954 RepID=A0A9D3YFG7_DREPO|nr:hypothetical protein DPMN_084756 [Dreissena polymorpha]